MPSVNIHEQRDNQIGFDVYAPQILGNGYGNVKLLGIMDSESARVSTGTDLQARHTAVYPYLPTGSTPDNYQSYGYAVVQTQNGSRVAVGLPWINMSTLVVIAVKSYRITVTDVRPDDATEMAKILVARGFNVVSTEPIEGS